MKLLVTIVQDQDVNRLMDRLSERGFQFTRISTTGGFLKEGNTTLLIGMKDKREEEAVSIIKESSKSRKKSSGEKSTVTVGGALVFTLNVERWETY